LSKAENQLQDETDTCSCQKKTSNRGDKTFLSELVSAAHFGGKTVNRSLDAMNPAFKAKAIELLARAAEAGYPFMIIETLRTPEEHAANLAAGRSWTQHSKHLDGMAIDVAP
jgi:uncharacterized protein YcbK (DUF882 family)